MPPVIAASSLDKTGTLLTDVTVTPAVDGPADIVENSLILAHVAGVSSGVPTMDLATGFTAALSPFNVDGGVAVNSRVDHRLAVSSEPSTYTFTGSPNNADNGMAVKLLRIAGHDLTTPIHKVGTVATATATDILDITGVTTELNDCLVLYLFAFGHNILRTATWSGAAGASEIYDFTGGAVRLAMISGAEKVQSSAGATGTARVTLSGPGNSLVGVCVAIAPGPETAGPRAPVVVSQAVQRSAVI